MFFGPSGQNKNTIVNIGQNMTHYFLVNNEIFNRKIK